MKSDKAVEIGKNAPIASCSLRSGTKTIFERSSSLVMPFIEVPCTKMSSHCSFLYSRYAVNFTSVLSSLSDKKSWLVVYENGITASFPTPTRVIIARAFSGTIFVAEFITANLVIYFLGCTPNT